MRAKKFIKGVKAFLRLGDYKVEGKKKAIKDLLKKLSRRKIVVKKMLEGSLEKGRKKELKEELEILTLEIKKGKKILYKLYAKTNLKEGITNGK